MSAHPVDSFTPAKISGYAEVVQRVGLPLTQSVVLLGVIIYLLWWSLTTLKEQNDLMRIVIDANTKSNTEMVMTMKELKNELRSNPSR